MSPKEYYNRNMCFIDIPNASAQNSITTEICALLTSQMLMLYITKYIYGD